MRPCSTVWLRSMSMGEVSRSGAGRFTPGADRRQNRDQNPDHVDEGRRVGPIVCGVYDQAATAQSVEKLVAAGIGAQFLEGNHGVSEEQGACANPADEIDKEFHKSANSN